MSPRVNRNRNPDYPADRHHDDVSTEEREREQKRKQWRQAGRGT